MLARLFLVGMFWTLGCAASYADPAEAAKSRLSWSAFECSMLAEMSGNETEQARLFGVGYDAGRAFLSALQSGRVTQEETRTQSPIGFLMVMGGPSHDFMLGRIYAAAVQNAWDDIQREMGDSTDSELRRLLAVNEFQSNNCTLLR